MLTDVIVPGPWWNALTYETDDDVQQGARVRVPIGRGARVGFALGAAEKADTAYRIRRVIDVLDGGNALGTDIWALALWAGRSFLCGAGTAIQSLCPRQLLAGEPLPAPVADVNDISNEGFRETHCFDPRDDVRSAFYIEAVRPRGTALVMFPEVSMARSFIASLPDDLKDGALLWPSSGGKKLWDAWLAVRCGSVRLVIGAAGAVQAPFRPELIIVDEESSRAFVPQRPPRISARSLAGKRAALSGAELILGGRMPSSKTFVRSMPKCSVVPEHGRLLFVDIRRSLKGTERGVEGDLPLSLSLLNRTRECLAAGRSALWLLDRRGEAAEVFCAECGHSIKCPRCGGQMRSEDGGNMLRCIMCAHREPLPDRCPGCKGELWQGRRPGLEALAAMAVRLIKGARIVLYDGKSLKTASPSLVLGTRQALALCGKLDIGLAAWLDLDTELRRPDYISRFNAFSMIWESYWRGLRGSDSERIVLIQGRMNGPSWRDTVLRGWERFWRGELSVREELGLPPHGLLARIDLPKGCVRDDMIRSLEEAGLFVMDPGTEDAPLWVTAVSAPELSRALAPQFEIAMSKRGFPVVTLFAE